MTSQTKKSNIDYVREYIETHGNNAMKAEALEFLNAIAEELADASDDLESEQDEVKRLEVEIDEKDSRITELEEMESDLTIVDCGIGKIEWKSDNLQLQQLMEEYTSRIAGNYVKNSVTLF